MNPFTAAKNLVSRLFRRPSPTPPVPPRCGFSGCIEEPIECRHSGTMPNDPPDEWLCPNHAEAAGYCWSCGDFWAGIESFDFGSPRGLCEHCRDEIAADCDDGWDDEEGSYDPFLEDYA